MPHFLRTTLPLALLVSAIVALPLTPASAVTTRTLSVTGVGAEMYPAYDPNTLRYGIRTSPTTGGTLDISATTSDAAGKVLINGQPATGTTRITGLSTGDEISVIFDDDLGRSPHSLIYLPSGFPRLEASNSGAGLSPQAVALTLTTFSMSTPSPTYETVVDRFGVPFWAQEATLAPMDLKQQLGCLDRGTPRPERIRSAHSGFIDADHPLLACCWRVDRCP